MVSRLRARRRNEPLPAPTPTPGAPAQAVPEAAPPRSLSPQPILPTGSATEILYARVRPQDIAEIESRLNLEHHAFWNSLDAEQRKPFTLAFGLHYEVPAFAERTGLNPVNPPSGVHLMGRESMVQTGGSYYYADMVLECLSRSEQVLGAGDAILDFSCSSGRVVRALTAALPGVRWVGCDPNAEAIRWASENLSGIEFFVSPTTPPLPLADGSLDAAFAISVWSHFSAAAALRWLDEMRRVIRPGGHLILTTHGFHSTVWFTNVPDDDVQERLGASWLTRTIERLEQDGHCFWDVFGQAGDMGVVDPDWGLSFFTPEWLLEHVTPDWSLTFYRVGRADGNQDAFVLRRR